jgi:hypothetical protein
MDLYGYFQYPVSSRISGKSNPVSGRISDASLVSTRYFMGSAYECEDSQTVCTHSIPAEFVAQNVAKISEYFMGSF